MTDTACIEAGLPHLTDRRQRIEHMWRSCLFWLARQRAGMYRSGTLPRKIPTKPR